MILLRVGTYNKPSRIRTFCLISGLLLPVLIHGFISHSALQRQQTLKRYSIKTDTFTEPAEGAQLLVDIKGNIKSIRKEVWNSLLADDDSPFLEYDWIYSLEESGCATEANGWRPLHVLVREEGRSEDFPLAVVPLYLKEHSMGEFIFDHQWAEASYQAGIRYYPKLLVAVPFTPAAGRRIMIRQGLSEKTQRNVRRSIGMFLKELAENSSISSVHINFCTAEEVEDFSHVGFLHRKSLQYHWSNEDKAATAAANEERDSASSQAGESGGQSVKYKDFESYLSNFASKRRIKVRRERKSVYDPTEGATTLRVLRGSEIPDDLLGKMFDVYMTTIIKNPYGRQYLTREFFKRLGGDFRKNLCFIIAEKNGRLVAGTFNIVKAGRFYGRYWGSHEYVKNLHFETCYYKAIEYCIEEGLEVMEPGAGGGDFKFLRGFNPQPVSSMHYCVNRSFQAAVKTFLKSERESIDEATEYLMNKSSLKARGGEEGKQ